MCMIVSKSCDLCLATAALAACLHLRLNAIFSRALLYHCVCLCSTIDAAASNLGNWWCFHSNRGGIQCKAQKIASVHAAINNQATCTSVGGVWSAATCQLLQQPVCDQAQGNWRPQKRDSLVGGMDLLYVGLMQVRPHCVIHIPNMVCRGTCCAAWT